MGKSDRQVIPNGQEIVVSEEVNDVDSVERVLPKDGIER
jgi:hypothetical protein